MSHTHKIIYYTGLIALCVCYSCAQAPTPQSSISKKAWGEVQGQTAWLYTLSNRNGMKIKVSNYGATLTDVVIPDKDGYFASVVLGFDSLDSYLGRHPNFGSTIGRYANRISNAEFLLNDTLYKLKANRKQDIIHGGSKGFSRQLFQVDTAYAAKDTAIIKLCYTSPDKEEGFPGTLFFHLTYKLTNSNEIILEYKATTDKPTVINLTNHSYFNLTGCKETVLNHEVSIMADSFVLTTPQGIPTGELAFVQSTPYDFTTRRKVGEHIQELEKGYDLCYKLNKQGHTPELAACIFDPASGRTLEAYTTEPSMQFFVGNADMSQYTGHDGKTYDKYYGLCLEMQHFPDSPHQPGFPNVVLRPGEVYRQTTLYKFGILNPHH